MRQLFYVEGEEPGSWKSERKRGGIQKSADRRIRGLCDLRRLSGHHARYLHRFQVNIETLHINESSNV